MRALPALESSLHLADRGRRRRLKPRDALPDRGQVSARFTGTHLVACTSCFCQRLTSRFDASLLLAAAARFSGQSRCHARALRVVEEPRQGAPALDSNIFLSSSFPYANMHTRTSPEPRLGRVTNVTRDGRPLSNPYGACHPARHLPLSQVLTLRPGPLSGSGARFHGSFFCRS